MINVIVVAAGRGLRMRNDIKKQYLSLNGLPIISYVLKTFDTFPGINTIYLVVPKFDANMCKKKFIYPLKLSTHVEVINGGSSRQDSVFNGLKSVKNKEGIVIIHDGVRPLVTKKLILRCIKGATKTGACVPVLPVTDSLKKNVIGSHVKTISRENFFLAQTPQVFDFNLIFRAHCWAKNNNFTAIDDSSILETLGNNINVVKGDQCNIKITTPQDIVIAEGIVKNKYLLL